MDALYTTKNGLERFRARLEEYRNKYFKVCASNEDAAGAGDNSVWHDNFAYEENQRLMTQLSRQVREMEQKLAMMQIITPPEVPDKVMLGCMVTVKNQQTGEEKTYQIAGYEDGNPNAGRISYTSPLAQALLGTQVGDEVTVVLLGRRVTQDVVAIVGSKSMGQR